MKAFFRWLVLSLVFVVTSLGSVSSAQALSLILPTPQFQTTFSSSRPTVIATTPGQNERTLSSVRDEHPNAVPRLTVLFSERIAPVTTAKNIVVITNDPDGGVVLQANYSVTILGNALYVEDFRWYADSFYTVTIDGSQVKSAKTGAVMGENYNLHFRTNKTRYINLPAHDESEPVQQIDIQKVALVPTAQIVNNANALTTYRITMTPYGAALRNVTIKDVLPTGFSFDSIVGGNVNDGKTVSVSGSEQLTFSLSNELRAGQIFYFDYRVKVSGQVNSGVYVVAPGTYHNLAIAKGYFTPIATARDAFGENNFRTAASDNRGDRDNVVVSRKTTDTLVPVIGPSSLILPTPILSPLPTRTANPTSTPSSSPSPTASPTASPSQTAEPVVQLTPPDTDALTCLQVNGTNSIAFSDVRDTDIESIYIRFLNTTAFANVANSRLVKGYPDNSFGPNNTLTRFELTKIALGANCIDYLTSPTANSHFVDVPQDNSELSLVIGKAYAEGIVKGVGDQFFPNKKVSFGEMIKILVGGGVYFDHGTAKTALAHSLTGITDDSFRQFAEHAASMRLLNFVNNNFPQDELVTRKSMAQAAARYVLWLKKLPAF